MLRLENARALFNVGKGADDFAVRIENRSTIIVVRERSSAMQPAVDRPISSLAGTVVRGYISRSLLKMKASIHPEYYETDMVCACGTVYHTRSTRRDIKIGICAACHPFFTGEQKFVDTAGRVEKFARRYGSTKAARAEKKA